MNVRNNTKYTTEKVKSTIESNNSLASSYNGRIEPKLFEMDYYCRIGQGCKTVYEKFLADLNSKKEQADRIFAQYGDSKFATPAITNPDDTQYAEQNECCKIVEEIIDIKSQLDQIYQEGTTNGEVAKCGFFGVNISPVIDVYKKLLSKGNELIRDGNSILSKIQLLDDLTDDTITDQALINDIDKYFQNCKEYNQIKNVERPATISSVKSEMNSAESQFDHEGKTNISDILNRHPPCHCDEVNIWFYNDPSDYTDEKIASEAIEYKSYKEKPFNKYDGSSSRTAPTGISIGENVTFKEWIKFSETDSFNADTPVYGSWDIKPIVEVEIEGQDTRTLDIGIYSMFSEPQSDADNAVNTLIDELNNKEDSGEEGNNSNENEDEEKEYELESSPTDYCVTAKNYTLKYKVKRNSSVDECDITFYGNLYNYTDATTSTYGTTITVKKGIAIKDQDKDIKKSVSNAINSATNDYYNSFKGWKDHQDIMNESFDKDTDIYGTWDTKLEIQQIEDRGSFHETIRDTKECFSDVTEYLNGKLNDFKSELGDALNSMSPNSFSNETLSPTNRSWTLSAAIKKFTLTLATRHKTGVSSYSKYTEPDVKTVFYGDSYQMNDNNLKDAELIGYHINEEENYKVERDCEEIDNIYNITADHDFRFTYIDLYTATYNDKNGNAVGTKDKIEAYTAFDLEENAPRNWPTNPYIENNITYNLCADPNTYSVEGGPLSCVTSDIEITPQYEEGKQAEISVKFCGYLLDLSCDDINHYDGDSYTPILSVIKPYQGTVNKEGKFELKSTIREQILADAKTFADEFKELFKTTSDGDFYGDEIKDIFSSGIHLKTPTIDINKTIEYAINGFGGRDIYQIHYTPTNEEKELYKDEFERANIAGSAAEKINELFFEKIKEVAREPFYEDKRTLNTWPQGYEIKDIIAHNNKEYLIIDETAHNSVGRVNHFRIAEQLPYVHFVYSESTPDDLLKGTEITSYQFNRKDRGSFSDLAVSGVSIEGYEGGYFTELSVEPISYDFIDEEKAYWNTPKEERNHDDLHNAKEKEYQFFSDITFEYEYRAIPSVVYEYVIDPSVQPEDKSAINTAYNNDTSSDGGTITCDAWTPGYQYNKANFLTNFGESITYEIRPDELPAEISDTYHATITYYGYYEYWDEGEYVENSGVVHFWGAYNSETETYSEPVATDIVGTVGESWTSKIRIVGGQASIVEVTEHEISDTRTKQLPGTSPMDVGGQSFNWWWEDGNGNRYTPGSSITIPVNDQPIETASRVITIVGGQVIANTHNDGPVAELNLLRVLDI